MTGMTGQNAPSEINIADNKLAGGADTWDHNAATPRYLDMKTLVSENRIKFNPSGVLRSLRSPPGAMGTDTSRPDQIQQRAT